MRTPVCLMAVVAVALAASAARAEEKLVTKTYEVGDLIAFRNAPTTQEAELLKLVTAIGDRSAWIDFGGRGSACYFPLTMSLVVNQTPAMQGRVEQFLAVLRKWNDGREPVLPQPVKTKKKKRS